MSIGTQAFPRKKEAALARETLSGQSSPLLRLGQQLVTKQEQSIRL